MKAVNSGYSTASVLSSIKAAQRKGCLFAQVGREYKARHNEVWSYSDSDFDGDYDNSRGTFFHNTDFDRDEVSMQEAGFVLNRIYFNYGTSTKNNPTAAVLTPMFKSTT